MYPHLTFARREIPPGLPGCIPGAREDHGGDHRLLRIGEEEGLPEGTLVLQLRLVRPLLSRLVEGLLQRRNECLLGSPTSAWFLQRKLLDMTPLNGLSAAS